MAEEKQYIVKEPFRYGGQSYLPGAPITLAVMVAAELAPFLEEAPPGAFEFRTLEEADQSELAALEEQLQQVKDQLALAESAKSELQAELSLKDADLTTLGEANTKTVNDLAATKEKLAAMGKELGELKKAAKKEGGK